MDVLCGLFIVGVVVALFIGARKKLPAWVWLLLAGIVALFLCGLVAVAAQ